MLGLNSLWGGGSQAPLVGIDISSTSVKVVELGRSRAGTFVVESFAAEPLGNGWVVDGDVERFDEVADAVRRVLRKAGTKAKQVALALPSSMVITRRIILPGDMTEQEMELQVESEAHHYIPFSIDEVALDYCVIGPSAGAPGDVDVMIAAVRKEKVQDRQGVAEAAGLQPSIVDIDSYAARSVAESLIRRLPQRGRNALVALVDIGAYSTSIQIIRNGEVLHQREQGFGGGMLTHALVRQYGFSMDEAEEKKLSGELPANFKSEVLAPFLEQAAQEVNRALQLFYASAEYQQIDHVLLAGGSAALPGLTEVITRNVLAPCTIANPFEGMSMGSNVRLKNLTRQPPAYITACGLAMRRFLK